MAQSSNNSQPAVKTTQMYNNQQNKMVKDSKPLVINETNKHVLGGYFSLGLNNFHKTVLNIFAKAGIKVTASYSEEKIGVVLRALYKTVSNEECNVEEKNYASNFKLNSLQLTKLQKLLFHHFPILGPVMAGEAAYNAAKNKKSKVVDYAEKTSETLGVTLSQCLDVISNIAQCLIDCRNTHVHYSPYNSPESLKHQQELQSKIVIYLDKTFVASRRLDKDRNKIDTKMMEFLTGYAKNDQLESYKSRCGFPPKYDEIEVTENGKTIKKHVERDDFFYKIGQKTEKHKLLSGFGLCYFCAIFLSKSLTKQLLADIELFKGSPYPEECNDIIRDIMCIYRIRAPRGKKKFESSDNNTTLALDILNELRKCPRELFDVLTLQGQEFFEDKVNDSMQNNDDKPTVVKRFRSIDRFPYFAMRYIDENNIFTNIRFHVQLGKFRFKFYDAKCINGEQEVRSLQKEINGFGRLQEIEAKRKTGYGNQLQEVESRSVEIEDGSELDLIQFKKDTPETKPYITDNRAFYNIHNNRIGLYWNETFANGQYIPKNGDYIPTLNVSEEKKAVVDMPAPMAMLSVYELPALIFCQYLLSKNSNDEASKKHSAGSIIESIIIDKYNNLRQFFTDVSEGKLNPVEKKKDLVNLLLERYNLNLNEIPDKIV